MQIDVTDASPTRLAVGIEHLLEGGSILLDGVTIAVRDSRVYVAAFSPLEPDNLSASVAREELFRARTLYSDLLDQQPALRSAFTPLPVVFELLYDYGKGSILLGTLHGDEVTWARSFRPRSS